MKNIGLSDETYLKLFDLQTKLREAINGRVTFSEIIDALLEKFSDKYVSNLEDSYSKKLFLKG